EPAAGAVLVGGAAADDPQDAAAVAAGVGQLLQQQYAGALGPAGAVGVGGERLAAAVRRQSALPAELDERRGRGHDGHAARQGERALAAAQRLHAQVQRHQGGRAGGVHGDRRAFEPHDVGDAAGGDRAVAAVAQVAADVLARGDAGAVVVV